MLDQGCHLCDCTRFLMGPVRTVTAAASVNSAHQDHVHLSALLTFATGATGTLIFASHAVVMSPTLTVIGAAGKAVIVRNLTSLRIYPVQDDLGEANARAQVGRTWEHGANYRGISRPGYLEELESFALAISTGVPADPSLDDGWRALEVCRAILESAEHRRPVDLDQTL
jgi:predicted dehydrogenase